MTTTINTLENGNVTVAQTYFDGDDYVTMNRLFTKIGSYVHQVHPNGATSQICEGLLPTGPTLMVHDSLEAAIRKTLA